MSEENDIAQKDNTTSRGRKQIREQPVLQRSLTLNDTKVALKPLGLVKLVLNDAILVLSGGLT